MPDARDLVAVCNTGPLIALFTVGRLDLLGKLYSEVLIPGRVYAEFTSEGERAEEKNFICNNSCFKVEEVVSPVADALEVDLHRGEAEVLSAAIEGKADIAVIDELLARKLARLRGVRATGTLGVILKAKELGHVESVGPVIRRLRDSGIWLADEIVNHILKLAGE